jgi:hypothetical protein
LWFRSYYAFSSGVMVLLSFLWKAYHEALVFLCPHGTVTGRRSRRSCDGDDVILRSWEPRLVLLFVCFLNILPEVL